MKISDLNGKIEELLSASFVALFCGEVRATGGSSTLRSAADGPDIVESEGLPQPVGMTATDCKLRRTAGVTANAWDSK
jgi:hypothetical protein